MSTVPQSRAARLPEVSAPVFILIGGLVAAAALTGAAVTRHQSLAILAVAGIVLAVVAAQRPVMLAAVALGATYAGPRIFGSSGAAGSSGGISYADLFLTAAFMCALPAITGSPEVARVRQAFRSLVVYLLALLPSVMLHHYSGAYLEWLHRLVLVGGSLTVGVWIAREHRTSDALRLLLAVGVVFAVAAGIYTLQHGLKAAYPLGQNKNFVGSLLSLTIVLLVAAPREFALPAAVRVSAGFMLAVGLLSTQSRGAALGAALGIIVGFARRSGGQHQPGRLALGVLLTLAFVGFAALSVRSELRQTRQEVTNSSIGVRFSVEKVTRQIWRTSPATGVGLKYFNTGNFGPLAQPANNAIDNELAESGVIGAIGFVLMEGGVILAVAKRREPLAVAALGVLLDRLLHGMVDIYWTAGDTALPFIVAGIALARSAEPRTEAVDGGTTASALATR